MRRQPPIVVRPKKQRRSRSKRTRKPQRIQLSERDRVGVLKELALHRFLSAEQLNRLSFQATPRLVRRRLRQLFDADLIERIPVVAQPTKGVPAYLYALTAQGADVIAPDMGQPIHPPSINSRSLRFVTHHVMVTNFYVILREALALRNRQLKGTGQTYRILQWQHEWQLKVPQPAGPARAERVAITEPATAHRTATSRQVTFLPDAFFELGLPNGDSLFFFYEMDLATHAHSIWRDRARSYAQYARPELGLFRRRFGGGRRDTFRLLIVCPRDFQGRSRCNNLLATIEETVGQTSIILATTLPELRPLRPPSANCQGRARDQVPSGSDAILTPIWRQVGSARRCSLLPSVRVCS